MNGSLVNVKELLERIEARSEVSFGAEEEVMVLDPVTHDLLPAAESLLSEMPDPSGIKLEMPASHLELVSPVCADLGHLFREMTEGRQRLAAGLGNRARAAAAAVHPTAAPEGELNRGERYERTLAEYGPVARHQLVCGVHVHVGLPGAEATLEIYNALRSYLPLIAALGANAPLYVGRDTGMASVRPSIGALLPRQGVPPAFASWEELAEAWRWGEAAGRLRAGQGWWWELRVHPQIGTLEVRVPDAQTTLADLNAVIAVTVGTVLWLLARRQDGEALPVDPAWRIAENRWSAARHGVHGVMLDLVTGEGVVAGDRLTELVQTIRPHLGASADAALAHAEVMCSSNGADRQRALAAEAGVAAAPGWLADQFLTGVEAGA